MGTTAEASLDGRDFNSVFEAGIGANGGLRNGGVSDRLRDRLVREEHAKLHRQGWSRVTIVNLQPFAINVNLGELGVVALPPASEKEPLQKLVIKDYRFSMRDLGDGNFTPVSILPSEIAKEVVREYGETGGVFWYEGDGDPNAADIGAARERQTEWYRKLYQQGVDSWSRYHQHKMLTDRQRDAARALVRTGEIAELPEWVTMTRAQSDRRPCPMCGEDIKIVARVCRFCHSKIAPSEAAA